MMSGGARLAYPIAVALGLALWFATVAGGDRAEPWDTGAYWTVSYPMAMGLCAILGFAFPAQPWRWAAALFSTQIVVMAVGGSDLSLLPMGLVVLAILALPGVGMAILASKLRRRRAPS